MKKLFVKALIATAVCACIAQEPGQSNISGTLWARYVAQRTGAKTDYSKFEIARGYFGWHYQFTNKISSRFTVDIFSDDKVDSKYKALTHGAGLKIKYAMLNFSEIYPDAAIEAGIIKNYFGVVYDWNYTAIDKALEDREKVCASADAGVALVGYIPKGFGEYQVAIYNGEGYNKTVPRDLDRFPIGSVNVRLIPIPGITLGASARYGRYEWYAVPDSLKGLNDGLLTDLAGVARFSYKFVDLWVEYISMTRQKDPDDEATKAKSEGFMIMPIITLKPIQLLAKYDKWNPKIYTAKDAYTNLTAGINYIMKYDARGNPLVQLQVNWQRKAYEIEKGEAGYKYPHDQLLVQLRYDFKSNPF